MEIDPSGRDGFRHHDFELSYLHLSLVCNKKEEESYFPPHSSKLQVEIRITRLGSLSRATNSFRPNFTSTKNFPLSSRLLHENVIRSLTPYL